MAVQNMKSSNQATDLSHEFDYAIIGSGFGGSVSALRLAEKGFKVIVIEKGKWLGPKDFPKSNWNLKKWLWMPAFKFYGLFKMTFLRHVTIFSGVGVGGGSLVYANTLPVPKKPFFNATSWKHLANWSKELQPFYKLALYMLGAARNPKLFAGDEALKELAIDLNKEKGFETTNVAVFFGEAGKTVKDPYFGGRGPDRTGCEFCGGCMLGCQHNAKNTLDKNYLFFAQKFGAKIQAECEVYDVTPLGGDGSLGYEIKWKRSTAYFGKKGSFRAKGIVFAGGVLGTIKLLLSLKTKSMTRISDMLGENIRTNSESLTGVVSENRDTDLSKGVAIGSILNIDEHTHLELVRYPAGSGFFRLLLVPAVYGKNIFIRLFKMFVSFLKNPIKNIKVFLVPDFAKYSQVLLFMQSIESTLKFKLGCLGLKSKMSTGQAPTPFIPLAYELADKFAEKINGKVVALAQETFSGIASTAHILGGACMGRDESEGVIDKNNRIFGYENAFVCDGSTISANIGVNPSLTITALTERAMSKIAPKKSAVQHIGYPENQMGRVAIKATAIKSKKPKKTKVKKAISKKPIGKKGSGRRTAVKKSSK